MYRKNKVNVWRKQLINIAKDFGYPPEVIKKLEECETENQASVIMGHARRANLG